MTLADILKPSLTVLGHAEVKGIQIGAGLGTLSAIQCLLLHPSLINKNDDPPLVAIANIAGVGAIMGASTLTLSCAYKLSKLDKAGIIDRAEKISTDKEVRKVVAASAIGNTVGYAIVATRVWGMAKDEGKCVFGLTFRKETAWEMFAFGAMGIAVGAGVYKFGKLVCEKFDTGNGLVSEIDEGVVGVDTATAKETVDSVVDAGEDLVKKAEEELKKTELKKTELKKTE